MTTSSDALFRSLQRVLPADRWMSLQDIDAETEALHSWDAGDLEPEAAGSKQQAWKRNIRNVLQSRVRNGLILKDGKRPRYRLLRKASQSGASGPKSGTGTPLPPRDRAVRERPTSQDATQAPDYEFEAGDIAPPERVETRGQRVVRDTALVRRLKVLFNDECLRCRMRLEVGGGRAYSEGHHLRPLGQPHNGPDVASNVMIVCPNCHALLDVGSVPLSADDLWLKPGHRVATEYISNHNRLVARRFGHPAGA
jgi:hypothetical protein